MPTMYLVIERTEDGTHITYMDKGSLLDKLNEEPESEPNFLCCEPNDRISVDSGECGMFIFQARAVVPDAIETVTKWQL
jgi:hypothetical protein